MHSMGSEKDPLFSDGDSGFPSFTAESGNAMNSDGKPRVDIASFSSGKKGPICFKGWLCFYFSGYQERD